MINNLRLSARAFALWLLVPLACASPATFRAGPQLQENPDADLVKTLVSATEAERPKVTQVVAAKDKLELERQGQPTSTIGRMMYATQAYALGSENAEVQLLRSLPKSAEEIVALYEFTHRPGNQQFEPLFREFRAAAFRSVVRHPEYLNQVFSVATRFNVAASMKYDYDGDFEGTCNQLGTIYGAIPSDYDAAMAREDNKDVREVLRSCAMGEVVRTLVSAAEAESPKLRQMVAAKDDLEFERQGQPTSTLGRMVHAARAYALGSEGAEIQLLRSLPKSAEEMQAFRKFAYDRGDPLYREFYAAAFQSVIKHPEYLHDVFSVATQFHTDVWSMADDIDWFCFHVRDLYSAIPKEYDAAVAREDKRAQSFLSFCTE